MIEIKPARTKDIPLLRVVAIETQIETFGPHNAPENIEAFLRDNYSVEKFEQEFLEPNSIYYLAWEGKEVAGFLRLRVTDEVKDHLGTNTVELQRIYVGRNFQGKKIGAQLMQKAIDYGKEKKFEWLWLGVWEHNLKAQEFYEKWGFKKFAEHVFWMGPEAQNDWLLSLPLGPENAR